MDMTNILVKDDATSPVEITFIPQSDSDGVSFWRTAIPGVPFEGQMSLWFSEEGPNKDGSYRRTVKVEVPVMETLGAAGTSAGYVAPPKVAYKEPFWLSTLSNRRSTQADRANALKIITGILAGAYSTTGGGTLDNTSAGDAYKSSTRPALDFLINGTRPQ
jgi:hypothetical protein